MRFGTRGDYPVSQRVNGAESEGSVRRLQGSKGEEMETMERFAGATRRIPAFAFCLALFAGCTSGTMSGHSQNCSSSGGLLSGQTVTCEGTVETLGGRTGVEFGDDFGGEYRLEASIFVEEGEAEVYAPGAGDEELSLGSVSAGEPLAVDEVVELSEDSEVFSLDAGEEGEVRGLEYEGTVTPR